jgi:endonuclease/exonuclease/phosphatase family metal-dependent hydrolase
VFGSAAGCSAELARGSRLSRSAGTARFASWNLHWFPDGKPGKSESGADLSWLACVLWWLNADVVALQEMKSTPLAQAAAEQLVSELNRLSGARYGLELDDCGTRVPQHVGLLWNRARVTATDVRVVGELNPSGEACGNQLRPGLAARLRFPGGLDLEVVSAHFKSMADARSLELRRASFAALGPLLGEVSQRTRDGDLLLLGDLNTMGCESCEPPVSARDELTQAERTLATGALRFVPAAAAGTHFHEGRASLLDHALVATGMRELPSAARTRVLGPCAEPATPSSPRARRAAKHARQLLSDHCPIVLDLSDTDLD